MLSKPLVLRLDLSSNLLIDGRRKSVLESHAFENVREDMWTGVVDTDTRGRYRFYDPPPADSGPLQPSLARNPNFRWS